MAEKKSRAEKNLSKYKSYSELELLENIDAKKPNYEIQEEDMMRVMPEVFTEFENEMPQARTMPPGFKEPIGIKEGGFIAKGCGKVMNDRKKVTKMY
ncbi:hypothetical protein EBR37_00830 [bacterium]|nr:hypothetical protein [bacterium]